MTNSEKIGMGAHVTTLNIPDELEIAPKYTAKNWKRLTLDPAVPDSEDWERAFQMFAARIRKRFFEPVDELLKFDKYDEKTFGFAVLAIDCLVIETLQGFREGIIDHHRKSRGLFKRFLTQWSAFRDCLPRDGNPDHFASQVYDSYRCALHHKGATEGAFRVWKVGPMFVFENDSKVTVNRTCLHKNLKLEFDAYLVDLQTADSCESRRNFKTKMDAICGVASDGVKT